MLDAMTNDSNNKPTPDRLDACKTKLRELRSIRFERAALEERLKEVKARELELTQRELVDVLQETGINSLGLDPEGNMPKIDIELDDYFHANIPDDNKESAYKWLHKQGLGDMIKTTITMSFGLGEAKQCASYLKKLDKLGEPYDVKQGVPWNTLTAYVKGEFKAKRPITQKVLDMLGATVGRVAKVIEPKKEKK